MSENLWAKINSRNQIMGVAERLNTYFKSQKKGARFVSVQDIDFTQTLLGDVNNIQLEVKLNSDDGPFTHELIIREFKELALLEEEVERYNELERRCQYNPNYSLRAYARDLEILPSRLSDVLNGK